MRVLLALAIPLLFAACAAPIVPDPIGDFSVVKTGGEDLEVVIAERRIPPDTTLPRHYHPGEEIVLLLEGSAVHVEEGKPDRPMVAGERLVIPPGAIHAPRIGPDGARVIVIYLKPVGAEGQVNVADDAS